MKADHRGAVGCWVLMFDTRDPGRARPLTTGYEQSGDSLFRTFRPHFDRAVAAVADPAREPEIIGSGSDEVAESDPLDPAENAKLRDVPAGTHANSRIT